MNANIFLVMIYICRVYKFASNSAFVMIASTNLAVPAKVLERSSKDKVECFMVYQDFFQTWFLFYQVRNAQWQRAYWTTEMLNYVCDEKRDWIESYQMIQNTYSFWLEFSNNNIVCLCITWSNKAKLRTGQLRGIQFFASIPFWYDSMITQQIFSA